MKRLNSCALQGDGREEEEEHGEGAGGGWPGTETAKHLPLSLAVQAALGVLALPKEECNMLQPSQAKLS